MLQIASLPGVQDILWINYFYQKNSLDEVNYRFKTTVHKQLLKPLGTIIYFANTTNQKRHFHLNLRVLYSSGTDVWACAYLFLIARATVSLDRLLMWLRKKNGPKTDLCLCGISEPKILKNKRCLLTWSLLMMVKLYIT